MNKGILPPVDRADLAHCAYAAASQPAQGAKKKNGQGSKKKRKKKKKKKKMKNLETPTAADVPPSQSSDDEAILTAETSALRKRVTELEAETARLRSQLPPGLI